MSKGLHKNLLRQMSKAGVNTDSLPTHFLEMISKSYHSYDEQIEMTTKISQINELEIERANKKYNDEKEKQFEEILNRLPGYVSWFDYDLNYLGVNKLLAGFYGIDPHKFIHSKIGEVVKDENYLIFKNKIVDFLESKNELCSFDHVITNNMDKREVIVYVQKIESENIIFCYGIDVAEKMKMQREIEQQKIVESHNARIMSLGEMAAGIAHEINNPLAIIKGNAQLLDRFIRDSNTEEFLKKQSKILNATDRIIKIISNLKLLSKSTENEISTDVNFKEIVESAIELCHFKLIEKKVQVRSSFETDELVVKAISTELLQVIHNLLNNAIDAVEELDSPWVELKFIKQDTYLEISITDSGNGIPKHVLNKMWEPFFTTKLGIKGTGLGLPICKKLIANNHGEFYYDANSINTRFVIKLPLSMSSSIETLKAS